MTSNVVSMSDQLSKELSTSAALLKQFDTGARKLNDRDHFIPAVNQLEALTVAILSSASPVSLIGTRAVGARFDVGPETQLAAASTAAADYLRGTVTNLVRAGGMSQYESKHVVTALDTIRQLYSLVMGAVVKEASSDIARLCKLGPKDLINAAQYLSNAVVGQRPDSD